ncbi:MAG: hypothetical protein ACXQT3_01495, partial [Methermicoccaceae archaeon]
TYLYTFSTTLAETAEAGSDVLRLTSMTGVIPGVKIDIAQDDATTHTTYILETWDDYILLRDPLTYKASAENNVATSPEVGTLEGPDCSLYIHADSTNAEIKNNDLTGLAAVTDDGAGTAFKWNKGYATENSDIASIEGDGTTTQFSIAHGLVSTPSYVGVNPKAGAPVPDSIDADDTNITLTFSTAPASGTYYYWWKAEV